MLKLMFVDDEVRVLEALRRMLSSRLGSWHIRYASSGAAALEALGEDPADIVVTDMRMPGMDGAELLRILQDRHPATLRIVLSGNSEVNSTLRVMQFAHQMLTKPCHRQTLIDTIDELVATHLQPVSAALQRLLRQVGTLPSTPATYVRLNELLRSPTCSNRDIVSAIRMDASLAAKVLQLSNSAYFGRAGKISRLEDAVSLLGNDAMRHLVLTCSMSESLPVPQGLGSFTIERLQSHSSRVAMIASRIAGGGPHRLDAMTAGLLHDMGVLVVASRLPHAFLEIEERCTRDLVPRHEAERGVLGVDHGEIGAYVFRLWGLPASIVEGIARHAEVALPEREPLSLAALIALAECLAGEDEAPTGEWRWPLADDRDPQWRAWSESARRPFEEAA